MGALHAGHGSLIKAAREANDVVVVSVFVNPLQFSDLGECDDLELSTQRGGRRGLRGITRRRCCLRPERGGDVPSGTPLAWVRTGAMGEVLEGASRPGHFDGVATVVSKLFNLVHPTRAYFGQKDAQQVAVLRRMVADLDFPVELVAAPIVRAADGLLSRAATSA